jgi:hypothetical protein
MVDMLSNRMVDIRFTVHEAPATNWIESRRRRGKWGDGQAGWRALRVPIDWVRPFSARHYHWYCILYDGQASQSSCSLPSLPNCRGHMNVSPLVPTSCLRYSLGKTTCLVTWSTWLAHMRAQAARRPAAGGARGAGQHLPLPRPRTCRAAGARCCAHSQRAPAVLPGGRGGRGEAFVGERQ